MQALRRQLVDSVHAFASIYRNPSLRRLQLAWIGSSVGTWGYVVALMVYAYRQGGPAAVGLVGLIRWFPAAVAAPFGGMIGDRFPRLRVMVVSDLLRAVALAVAAAAIVLDAPAVIVYLLAILVTLVSQAFGPAESALLPTLAESPEELASANVASSTIEAAGYFVGPALGGVILAVSNVETVFVLTAVAFLWSAAVLALIRLRAPEPTAEVPRGSWQHEALAGFRTIWHDSRLRLIIGLFAAQTLVYGGFVVLIAVASIRLLGLGAPGIGYLNAALGVGGLIGGVVAVVLVGARRLALIFGLALIRLHLATARGSRGGAGPGIRGAPQRLLRDGGDRRGSRAGADRLGRHPRFTDRGGRRFAGGHDPLLPDACPHRPHPHGAHRSAQGPEGDRDVRAAAGADARGARREPPAGAGRGR
jgi:MFS family permease